MLFLESVWNILCELAPWLFLGMAISGLMHVFLPASYVQHQFSGMSGVLRAVLMGIPLPLCSCGVIPAAVGLKKDGASNGAAIGFLISTPQTGIDSILVSGSFLGWPFAFFKVFAALVTGLAGGWLTEYFQPTPSRGPKGTESSKSKRQKNWSLLALDHGLEIVRSIWFWLILGIVISASINTLLPVAWINSMKNLDSNLAILSVLLFSIPLYVCATASVPIAAALVANGFPPSAALVFLFAGPATNAATIGTIFKEFGARVLMIYLSVLILGSISFGYLFDRFLTIPTQKLSHFHDGHSHWIGSLASIVLIGLLLKFAISDVSRWFRSPAKTGRRVLLSGLHCQGCVHDLELALKNSPGINSAQVDLSTQTAWISGGITDADLAEVVHEAGFAVRTDGDKSRQDS